MSEIHRFVLAHNGLAAAIYHADGTATIWIWVHDAEGRLVMERHILSGIADLDNWRFYPFPTLED